MPVSNFNLKVTTKGKGLIEITGKVQAIVDKSRARDGICSLFITHTSASLLIQENADPTAKADLLAWFDRLVKEDDPLYTHTLEGSDDMPAHIKSALTNTFCQIPIVKGRLGLGTWQGIYLFEHRVRPHNRNIIVSIIE